MATLHLNGTEYDIDNLPESAKAQVVNLRFVESEIARMKSQLAVFETARKSYVTALSASLNAPSAVAEGARPLAH